MPRARRAGAKKLKDKLRASRLHLNLTMDKMAEELQNHGAEGTLRSSYIADYESGRREPSLLALLAYSKICGVSANVFIDDSQPLHPRITNNAEIKKTVMRK